MKTNIWETEASSKNHLLSIAENGYVPNSSDMRRKYGRYFRDRVKKIGGYQKIVGECSLKIKNHYNSSDGHILSSYYEYLFDEYLYLNNIPHEIDGFIFENSLHRYDFLINNVYVEIWGINKEGSKYYNNYCERRLTKEKLYKKHDLKLISIEGKDFNRNSIDLQTFFKTKLLEFNIQSQDNKPNYPVFNRRKIGYWSEKMIINELRHIIDETKEFPTFTYLLNIGKSDLTAAIKDYGGFRKFANLLGFEPKTLEFSETRVMSDLESIKEILGHFPCDRELQEMKRSDLASCIKSHGGYGYFKEKIEGARTKRPYGYWDDETNIISELQILCDQLGRFPKYSELGHVAKGINKSKKGLEYFKNKVESQYA